MAEIGGALPQGLLGIHIMLFRVTRPDVLGEMLATTEHRRNRTNEIIEIKAEGAGSSLPQAYKFQAKGSRALAWQLKQERRS